MKKLILIALASVFSASVYAADAENTESSKVDHSTNPITGTKTTTRKWNKKVKDGSGEKEAEVKETTKVKRDGTVKKEVEVESSSEKK